MTTFASAIQNQTTTTTNGMKALRYSSSACVDLFYKIGASRGKDIIPQFVSALQENPDIAIRIALWARDVRGGAGERKLFRDICNYLEFNHPEILEKLIHKIPEVGRWDDLLVFQTKPIEEIAYTFIGEALKDNNKLAYKWLPRQKSINKFFKNLSKEDLSKLSYQEKLSKLNPQQRQKYLVAKKLQKFFGLTERQYRKLLVNSTDVVESKMCSQNWNEIDFSKIPSLAHSRYKKAFIKNSTNYQKYLESLEKNETTINAGAVYPYDIIKTIRDPSTRISTVAQWNALPNYIGDHNILPMVDVSGSMCVPVNKTLSCIDIAVSLGLYLADKNTGKFKDIFLTFSTKPKLMQLKGDVVDKYNQMMESEWGMNTDLHKAFDIVLNTAINSNVPQEEMPKYILILSDMQFDQCTSFGDSAIEMIRRKYEESGYEMPGIIFWNLNSHDNIPVRFDDNGTAMISGFSPAIMKAVLKVELENLTAENVMLETIMNDKYLLSRRLESKTNELNVRL